MVELVGGGSDPAACAAGLFKLHNLHDLSLVECFTFNLCRNKSQTNYNCHLGCNKTSYIFLQETETLFMPLILTLTSEH